MKYYLDTEFIEGFHKPLFGKKRHFIDLISIGIVCEDGRTYYAISNEYSYHDANEWVKQNVILPMYVDAVHGDSRNTCDASNFHLRFGKSNIKILGEILHFFGCWRDQHFWRTGHTTPEVYGYYCDYDWVLFCSLFGRMIDLPKGFPMYCRDLKQMLDEKQTATPNVQRKAWPTHKKLSQEEIKEYFLIKNSPQYPKQQQQNEHNALADAKWNQQLHNFLIKI